MSVRGMGFLVSILLLAVSFGYVFRPRPIPVSRHQQVLDGPCASLDLKCGNNCVITKLAEVLSCQEIIVRCNPQEE